MFWSRKSLLLCLPCAGNFWAWTNCCNSRRCIFCHLMINFIPAWHIWLQLRTHLEKGLLKKVRCSVQSEIGFNSYFSHYIFQSIFYPLYHISLYHIFPVVSPIHVIHILSCFPLTNRSSFMHATFLSCYVMPPHPRKMYDSEPLRRISETDRNQGYYSKRSS